MELKQRERDNKKKEIFKKCEEILNFRKIKYHKSNGKYFSSLEISPPAGILLVIELEKRENKPLNLRFYKDGDTGELASLEQFSGLLHH